MVEPFIDKDIGIETQKQVNAGKIIDFAQQSQYRVYPKEGEIVAATVLGTSLASLFGVVFVLVGVLWQVQTIKNGTSISEYL